MPSNRRSVKRDAAPLRPRRRKGNIGNVADRPTVIPTGKEDEPNPTRERLTVIPTGKESDEPR